MSKIGRFGEYGGQYVPETVMNAVHELEAAYSKYKTTRNLSGSLKCSTEIMPAGRLCCIMPTR